MSPSIPTHVKVLSIEPVDFAMLWPAPSVTDTAEIAEALKGVKCIESVEDLTKEPHPIITSYRGNTMWLAPNVSFYRHTPRRDGINQYTCMPFLADCENVQMSIDGVMYNAHVEYNIRDALVQVW
jgi:hypothetical protein